MTEKLKYGRDGNDPEDMEVAKALEQMVGSKIIEAGFAEGEKEGGLAFDYEHGGVVKRIVFGYNELGEWIQSHEIIEKKR